MGGPEHHTSGQLDRPRANLPDKIAAVFETIDRDGRGGFKIRKRFDELAVAKQHPGVEVVGFQLGPHALERGNVSLKGRHRSIPEAELDHSRWAGANQDNARFSLERFVATRLKRR
jgi:hypothetical protein